MAIHRMTLAGVIALSTLGCGHAESNHNQPKTLAVKKTHQGSFPINAVGTTGMVADLIRHVGGDHVRTRQLFGADVDPHLYKATDADTAKLAAADIIFYSGLHLEGKMTEIFDSMGRKLPCFGVADHLDRQLVHKDEEGAVDPHVWFDVTLWSGAAGVVRDALALYDPSHAGDYQANCDRYQQALAELHAYAQKRLLEVPEKQRVLVTSHDAFRYFGRAYKLDVKGIQGISTESEASVAHITQLVNFIVERKVKAVFVETSVNPRNMRALIEGCASRGHKVIEGGELFSDAMGKEGTPEGTYVGMIRHNVDTIVNALR
jgi:manganese/zinc/iron transport system substrate-binding protein